MGSAYYFNANGIFTICAFRHEMHLDMPTDVLSTTMSSPIKLARLHAKKCRDKVQGTGAQPSTGGRAEASPSQDRSK